MKIIRRGSATWRGGLKDGRGSISTQSGALKVGAVEPSGPAALASLSPGATLKAVNGTLVHDAVHLEGLLLQTPGVTTSVTFDPGGTVALPTP